MDKLDHLGWVVHRAYEIDGVLFGVRTNSEACGQWLDDTFGAYGVDTETSPYFSVLAAEHDGEKHVGKRFHILYEESRALVKSLDVRDVAEALVAQFERVAAEQRTDAVFLDAALVRRDGIAALVPPILPPYLATMGHRAIDRSRLQLPLASFVALDLDTGNVIPPTPKLDLAADAHDRLADVVPSANGARPAGIAGPVDVDTICFLAVHEEPVTPISPGRSAHALATLALNLEALGGRAVETIGRLATTAQSYDILSPKPRDGIAALLQSMGSPAASTETA